MISILANREACEHGCDSGDRFFSKRFRKGRFDLSERIAVFTAPGSIHGFASQDMSDWVKSLCPAHGLAVVFMSSSTGRTQYRKRNLEPDKSFLIGETAARFLRIKANEGFDAALQHLGGQCRPVERPLSSGLVISFGTCA